MTRKFFPIIALAIFISLFSFACRDRSNNSNFTIAIDGKFSTLDPIGSTTVTANDERIRTLMYNSLVKKNEQFDYVGELASEIIDNEGGSVITFVLQDNVKFHDGKPLTSADVKYTLDKLFESNGAKASAFYDTVNGGKQPHIVGVETPDALTVNIRIARPALKNQLLANLVPVAIVPENSEVGTQASLTKPPLGTGPYKFGNFDTVQNVVNLTAFPEYWEGAPNIQNVQVKALPDASALQAELKSGAVDLAPGVINLAPDTFQSLSQDQNLKVEEFKGSNIQYLGFNTESPPLNNVKVRQAIAYAVNRERIINDLLLGQAEVAHSILPEEAWAFNAGKKYPYDLNQAKQLLDEAGFRDTNGDGKREMPTISFKISSGNQAVSQYAQMIQSQMSEVGIPVEIESLEFQTMLSQLQKGQYQMTTGRWVGGNQDPIFLRDLFASSEIPNEKRASRNRSRYSNPQVDQLIEQAINAPNRDQAREYYSKAQEIISSEVPMLPLWYPSNMVVANKRVGNIQMNASGDWGFVRNLTVSN
ncbi:MAG TPA: ABC transporter substrate-binding protein [Pyrinomonadaceae bacterium]|nr:ABC transporter substrate-binding protein [Pyrinomonadaceae bacterium]